MLSSCRVRRATGLQRKRLTRRGNRSVTLLQTQTHTHVRPTQYGTLLERTPNGIRVGYLESSTASLPPQAGSDRCGATLGRGCMSVDGWRAILARQTGNFWTQNQMMAYIERGLTRRFCNAVDPSNPKIWRRTVPERAPHRIGMVRAPPKWVQIGSDSSF